MSIAIGIIPPESAREAIRAALRSYADHLDTKTPEDTWYIPLVLTNSLPTIAPLRQAFHQTLRLLSIGEGDEKETLWARVQETPALESLRTSAIEHLQLSDASLIPAHISLGSFATTPAFGIIDTPLGVTFNIKELALIQIDPYEIITTIPLTP